jgi:hypothetical protein
MKKSYVILSASRLKPMCEALMQVIEADRDEMMRAWVDRRIAEHERSWVRRLLRQPVMTREQAMEVTYDPGDERIFITRIHCGLQYAIAQRLLVACDVVENIAVTVEDLAMIIDSEDPELVLDNSGTLN